MDEITIPELAYYQLRTAYSELKLRQNEAKEYIRQAQADFDRLLGNALSLIDPSRGMDLLTDYQIDLETRKLVPSALIRQYEEKIVEE